MYKKYSFSLVVTYLPSKRIATVVGTPLKIIKSYLSVKKDIHKLLVGKTVAKPKR